MSTRSSKSPRPQDFLARHPVFTHAGFVRAHTATGRSEHTSNGLLAGYVASGRAVRIRRGLYATVPAAAEPETFAPDPYLVACHLSADGLVAYHAALAFHGRAYSDWRRVQILTAARLRTFEFRGIEYQAVQAPASVRELPDFGGGVLRRPHAGGTVRVASLERCLVDLMHSPEHGGGWEEIWRSLEMVEFFDLERVIALTTAMRSAVTAARVGFFLESHREALAVEERHLARIEMLAPAQPRYLDSRRESGRLQSRWNLVVPSRVLERAWEEPG